MTRGAVWLLLLAPMLASAQLSVVVYDGRVEMAAPALYDFGSVGSGITKDARFRARNTGIAAIVLTKLTLSGAGFTLIGPPSIPYTLAPGNFVEFPVRFTAGAPASYSGNLLVNTTAIALSAISLTVPDFGVSGCTGPDASRAIGFGSAVTASTNACTFSLENSSTGAQSVAVLAVSGSAFRLSGGARAPLTLYPGDRATFDIDFKPPGVGQYFGTLTIDQRSYTLSGRGFSAPLPKPILEFDTAAIGSAQQRRLTMRLPTASPAAASGSVTLTFTPATQLVTDDPAILFVATGTRMLPFSVKAGDTQVTLNGQASAIFQTGTSAGTLTFTVNAGAIGINGDPTTTLNLAPSAIAFDSIRAIERSDSLQIDMTGYDNTYTAGVMSFTFYNAAGQSIGPGTIPADFTAAFRGYFVTQKGGSSFSMHVAFSLTGNAASLDGVEVALTNSAGVTRTERLKFSKVL